MAYVWNTDTGEGWDRGEKMFCAVIQAAHFSLVQGMQWRSTPSSLIPLLSMACLSTLMKTWLPSVPSDSANLSTRTCTITKVCLKPVGPVFPCETCIFHQLRSITASQLEADSMKAASATNKSTAEFRTIRNTSGNSTLLDTSAASALDQFAQTTRLALKTKSIKEQLDSVLVMIDPLAVLLPGSKICYMS